MLIYGSDFYDCYLAKVSNLSVITQGMCNYFMKSTQFVTDCELNSIFLALIADRDNGLLQVKMMSHAFLFGFKIPVIIGGRLDFDGYIFDDFQSVSL